MCRFKLNGKAATGRMQSECPLRSPDECVGSQLSEFAKIHISEVPLVSLSVFKSAHPLIAIASDTEDELLRVNAERIVLVHHRSMLLAMA